MIKLLNILKEINIQKKTSIGSGEQQSVYPYLKNPNYVIKKFDTESDQHVLDRHEIKYYLKVLEKYPKYIAHIVVPKENSKYYLQEKINIENSQNDIWDTVVEVIKKASLDLEKKYKTPKEAHNALDLDVSLFFWADSWEDIEGINDIGDYFDITNGEGIPMNDLFDDYIYANYSKNVPLVQKLKPVWDVGTTITQYGSFHEDNLGYDKDGNFKIIDI